MILIRRFKIAKQKANVKRAKDEAGAAADKAAKLATVYTAKTAEFSAILTKRRVAVERNRLLVPNNDTVMYADYGLIDAKHAADAAATDAATKALAATKIAENFAGTATNADEAAAAATKNAKQKANVKLAQDEADAAADKAARLATACAAKTAECATLAKSCATRGENKPMTRNKNGTMCHTT